MHQNKIPRPAENRIIRIGDGAVFLIILQIRCVAPSMANTAIERKSGANPACKSVRPNSVDSAMLSAVARIIATTHGRTPDNVMLRRPSVDMPECFRHNIVHDLIGKAQFYAAVRDFCNGK